MDDSKNSHEKTLSKSVRIQNATKNRYYDSPKVVDYNLIDVNDDGLLKLLGTYSGMRAFRYFYKVNDPAETRKIVEEMKHDILREFLSKLNEEAAS